MKLALLLLLTSAAWATDVVIIGSYVEIDGEPLRGGKSDTCENPQWDFYDTAQAGEYWYGDRKFCYDPCGDTTPRRCE